MAAIVIGRDRAATVVASAALPKRMLSNITLISTDAVWQTILKLLRLQVPPA